MRRIWLIAHKIITMELSFGRSCLLIICLMCSVLIMDMPATEARYVWPTTSKYIRSCSKDWVWQVSKLYTTIFSFLGTEALCYAIRSACLFYGNSQSFCVSLILWKWWILIYNHITDNQFIWKNCFVIIVGRRPR